MENFGNTINIKKDKKSSEETDFQTGNIRVYLSKNR
jgi:hypothetical protein